MELADFLFLALFSIGLPLFYGFAVAAAADPPQNRKWPIFGNFRFCGGSAAANP